MKKVYNEKKREIKRTIKKIAELRSVTRSSMLGGWTRHMYV